MRELLHTDIDFRGLTPGRNWQASSRDAVTALFLENWFEESDQIEELVHLESDSVADRQRVGYRFASPVQTVRSSSSSRLTWPSATDESAGCASSAPDTARSCPLRNEAPDAPFMASVASRPR